MNDELFYHAGDLTVPARPDSGMDKRQGPSGPGPKPDANDDDATDQGEDPIERKDDKTGGLDLGIGLSERGCTEASPRVA